VFIPIMVVVLLNVLLIRQLQTNNRRNVLQGERSVNHRIPNTYMRQKRRVTITVVAIALCFSLTQGPSAIMVLWELVGGYTQQSAHFYTIFSITNCLVVSGKTINFILFCVSSIHFRDKCFTLLFRKFPTLSQTSLGTRIIKRNSTSRTSLSSCRRGSQNLEQKQPKFIVELAPLAETAQNSCSR
uniref:G-protein coupled receptors family 1 profile domain-containing protein n=1 Tax=Parascaris univalens TaxID=6257 RepID=A0A915A9M6_PARUN